MRNKFIRAMLGVTLALAFVPTAAFASGHTSTLDMEVNDAPAEKQAIISEAEAAVEAATAQEEALEAERVAQAKAANYTISYDPKLIETIGSQEESGHNICCPSFSCAYADAVMDGTVNDHSYYSCSCCMWTDWGGGDSSFRSVGSDEELLREAYDQILQGKPTVIHVAASYGEHWIALIGYQDVTDPDALTLDNFIALDPWDGAQIVAGERFSLYGDGCEHISDR